MESDEALARRLQREEEEEAARYERDADYARSLLLSQQLGLAIKPHKKNRNTTKSVSHHIAQPTTHPQETTKGRRRRRGNKRAETEASEEENKKVARSPGPVSSPPPQQREEDERIEKLMSILRKLRVSSHHAAKDEYAPGELFDAVRWAFGPDFVLDASPPAHVANCQRLVEAWRAARATAALPSDESSKAEAAAAEFRAWLEAWEHGRHSDWERLPLEVMEMIFMWLPGDDPQHLLATRLVCRAWHEVTSEVNQPFWRRLFVAHRRPDDKALQQQSDKKEARRQEYLKLLQIAMRQDEEEGGGKNKEEEDDEEDDEVCWKRRYFEVLHGVDMTEYEEYETKGFRTKLINGPRPGKSRPNYGRASSSSSSSSSAKQRKRELERQQRRDRRSRYQARANAQGRAAKRDASW